METASPATPADPAVGVPDWRAILDRLAQRHSCRDFDGSEIDREILAEIVRDGTEAPSSCNLQNWHFVIVTDPESKPRARDISGGNLHFAHCSALIFLCFQKGWTHGNFSIAQSVAAREILLNRLAFGYGSDLVSRLRLVDKKIDSPLRPESFYCKQARGGR